MTERIAYESMLHRTLTEGQAPRDITAPFQNKPRSLENGCNIVDSDGSVADVNKSSSGNTYAFPALETDESLSFDKYCGPTPESNWVIPGKLLVGAYPASQSDDETFDLITSILKHGVSKFVCLQEEYREHGVTEAMWRSGNALRPYFEDVKNIVRDKYEYEVLNEYPIIDIDNLSFIHFPIRDCGITDDSRVLELAKTLVQALKDEEIIYLHCWGGHGRTGTVVCIMLHLIYGLDATKSMARCQSVHDLRRWPVAVGSPQTQTQRDQVTRVINKLINTPQALRRYASEPTQSTQMDITPMQHSPRPNPQHEKQGNSTVSTPNRVPTNDPQSIPQTSTPNPLLSTDFNVIPNISTPQDTLSNDDSASARIRSVSGTMDICSLDNSLLNSSCGEEYSDCVQNQAELLALNNGNLNLTFAHETDSNNIVGNNGISTDEEIFEDDDNDGNEVRTVEIVNSSKVKPPTSEKPSFNRIRKG